MFFGDSGVIVGLKKIRVFVKEGSEWGIRGVFIEGLWSSSGVDYACGFWSFVLRVLCKVVIATACLC